MDVSQIGEAERCLIQLCNELVLQKNSRTVVSWQIQEALEAAGLATQRAKAILILEGLGVLVPRPASELPKTDSRGNETFGSKLRRQFLRHSGPSSWTIEHALFDRLRNDAAAGTHFIEADELNRVEQIQAKFQAVREAAAIVFTAWHTMTNGMKDGETRTMNERECRLFSSICMELQKKVDELKPIVEPLEALATRYLHSLPGKWGIDLMRELDELANPTIMERPFKLLTQRERELANLIHLLKGSAAIPSTPPDANKAKGEAPTAEQPKRKVNPRDKYCYEQMAKGRSLKEIMAAVNKRKVWEPIATVQGISAAARRYANANVLPWPLNDIQR